MRKALIVVDVQNDFLTGNLAVGECPAKQDALKALLVINKIIKTSKWDLIVYTLDWHPKNHISFVTNANKFQKHKTSNNLKPEAQKKMIFEINGVAQEQILWPPHCIQGSWGAELHPDLLVLEKGCRVYKGLCQTVDSYSAFYDNNKVTETGLRNLLHNQNITETFICGIATDVCVNFTAIDSSEIGFKTNVVIDACAGVSDKEIEDCKNKWRNIGIDIVNSDEL